MATAADTDDMGPEEPIGMRNARRAAKTAVSRRINDIMQIVSRLMVEELVMVKQKEVALIDAMARFQDHHLKYHGTMTLQIDEEESQEYLQDVQEKYEHAMDKIQHYKRRMELQQTEAATQDGTMKLGESATSGSQRSMRSSISSALMKAAAEKASIMAELAALPQREELKEQQMRLSQAQEKLRLQTEVAKMQAKEDILAEAERTSQTGNSIPISQKEHQHIQSRATAVHLNNAPDATTANDVQINQHQPAMTQLNPMASEWRTQGNSHSMGPLDKHLISALHIPKMELICFDGEPLNYWGFIRSFDNTVGKEPIDSGTKLACLVQYTKGRARNVIQCCTVMNPEEGYLKARQLLEERFGNPFVITEKWIKKVTSGPAIKPNEREKLQDFADEIRGCAETLQAMGSFGEMGSQSSLLMIASRLPYTLQNKWRTKVHQIRKREERNPSIYDLSEFVLEAAEIANDPVYGGLADSKPKQSGFPGRRENFNAHAAEVKTYVDHRNNLPLDTCLKCSGSHSMFQCNSFKEMKVQDRVKFVSENKLCFNCLRPGHFASRCRINRTCTVSGCGKKHTKFLHQIVPKEHSKTNETTAGIRDGVQKNDNYCGSQASRSYRVALPILPVMVQAPGSQQKIKTYALLDSGSTSTFCSQDLINQLNIEGKEEVLCLTTLEKTNSKTKTTVVQLEVTGMSGKKTLELNRVYTRAALPISLEDMAKCEELNTWTHLKDVDIPHIDANNVTLLIGQDNPEALVPIDIRRGNPGEPYATKTALGWTLNGPLQTKRSNNHTAIVTYVQTEYDLDFQLEKFWKVEGQDFLKDDKRGLSVEDKRALDIWEESIQQRSDKHYMMAIPFRHRPPELPYNRDMAVKRLESLRRRLARDGNLLKAYKSFMENLIEEGYAEKVENDHVEKTEHAIWYLPHHNVHNPKKPDKVRVVYDCRASFRGVSLNSQVLQGPDLLNSLLGVLLRFRQFPVAVMSDIEAMFHQVLVDPADRDVLRFLWWPDGDITKDPEVWRMTVHLFGGTWSPSCCNFALQRTARDNRDKYDAETISTVMRNFYVDDCLKSIKDEDTAIDLVHQLVELLTQGGFRLTKWVSNSTKVINSIPEKDRAKQIKGLDLTHEALPVERALGVTWDVQGDKFGFQIAEMEKPLTKRGLLSVVSSVYDPFGFVCPFTIVAKKLMQDLTRLKVDWDDMLSDDAVELWLNWKGELKKLESFEITRCIQSSDMGDPVEIQLHHFSDASQMAYGTASYLRLKDSKECIQCCLLLARSRLAPMKQMTIPRLELTAATLAVQLDSMIRRELDLKIDSTTFWTDSTCVLQYIRSENRRFHTYVENRVSVIREGSDPSQWRYVDSRNNPADDCSRGLSADELLRSERWKHGPAFLPEDEERWPDTPEQIKLQISDDDPEVKKTKVSHAEAHEVMPDDDHGIDKLLTKRSSWFGLKRDIAWLLRFKSWIMRRLAPSSEQLTNKLTVAETESAEKAIIEYIQNRCFKEEIKALTSKSATVKKSSPLFRLCPMISHKGLLIIGSRLRNAPLPEEAIHQAILPKKHPVVDLIIQDYHEQLGHSGREHLLSQLRQKYWIVGGSTSVRRVLRGCFECRRFNAPRCEQKMADLPVSRVTPDEPPFTYVGVDIFGPFQVKRGRAIVKRYGCLFICFTVRAIHIEVIHSMDTSSFINALQRFVCRRGQPKEITSDNGTNFVGAEREIRQSMKDWNQTKIHDYLHQRGIQWKFNPPAASHMGGIWERSIRTVRKVLCFVMKEQTVDDEALSTLMCIVEAIVNGRPLSVVSDDPKDLEPLTPNHLLLQRQGPSLPPGHFESTDSYCRRRWRQVQHLANVFWRRWVKEYLPTLHLRQKWLLPQRNLKPGDVVLIADENTPRYVWPMGRVTETYPGADGLVRTVKVQTKASSLVRPVVKLCLLEEAS